MPNKITFSFLNYKLTFKKKLKFKKKIIFLGFFLLLTFFFFNSSKSNAVCKDCNVILVSLDTLSSAHLPCYGYQRNTATNLCKFANDNVIFTNSFSDSSWTLPSLFSIFTSLYPKHHEMELGLNGIEEEGHGLNSSFPTLTETLSSQGYETLFIGPTDSPSVPLDKGLGRGFKLFIPEHQRDLNLWQKGIDKLKENNKLGKKTFLFLYTNWSHEPYLTKDYSGKSEMLYTKNIYPQIPKSFNDYFKFSPAFFDFFKTFLDKKLEHSSEKEKKWLTEMIDKMKTVDFKEGEKVFNTFNYKQKHYYYNSYYKDLLKKTDPSGLYAAALYDESIYYLDKKLQEIFPRLETSELSKNTIIIIAPMHGEEFMEHGDLSHGRNLYNTSLNSPLIMYIPGIKNKKIESLVQGIDIYPTILGLLGIKKSENLEGKNLTTLIVGNEQDKNNRYLISQLIDQDAIRDNRWKLYIRYSSQKIELFDLKNDPKEQTDLARIKPEIVKRLQDALEHIIYKK